MSSLDYTIRAYEEMMARIRCDAVEAERRMQIGVTLVAGTVLLAVVGVVLLAVLKAQ